MIEQWGEDVGEDFEDVDDEKAHQDPLTDLLGQGVFHDLPEAEADNADDGSDHDRRPEHETFAVGADVHRGNSVNESLSMTGTPK